jgi:hypothetical protein
VTGRVEYSRSSTSYFRGDDESLPTPGKLQRASISSLLIEQPCNLIKVGQSWGAKVTRQEGNSPDRSLRFLSVDQCPRPFNVVTYQRLGLEAAMLSGKR